MKIKQALRRARAILLDGNTEDVSLECEVMLRHVLEISRVQLYLNLENELLPEQEKTFWNMVQQHLKGEPVAYITRRCEFYGLDFYVDPDVLIPRPESESLVDKALNLAQNRDLSTIADIGTGCGAIAISLAKNLPESKIYATDISAAALEVARHNCQKHGVTNRIYLVQGDMLDPLPEPVDLIIANLPYVRESELRQMHRPGFEPRLALDGGPDGLRNIRRFCYQLRGRLYYDSRLLLEIGQGQAAAVTVLISRLFPSANIEVSPDLGGIDRVVSLTPATAHRDKPASFNMAHFSVANTNC